jgi:hypothetical protein
MAHFRRSFSFLLCWEGPLRLLTYLVTNSSPEAVQCHDRFTSFDFDTKVICRPPTGHHLLISPERCTSGRVAQFRLMCDDGLFHSGLQYLEGFASRGGSTHGFSYSIEMYGVYSVAMIIKTDQNHPMSSCLLEPTVPLFCSFCSVCLLCLLCLVLLPWLASLLSPPERVTCYKTSLGIKIDKLSPLRVAQ